MTRRVCVELFVPDKTQQDSINVVMSRSMTAAQIIALGEYLDPDFDPSSLTVNQLLGVFGFHNIRYPTPTRNQSWCNSSTMRSSPR
jgi:hypothetical protein